MAYQMALLADAAGAAGTTGAEATVAAAPQAAEGATTATTAEVQDAGAAEQPQGGRESPWMGFMMPLLLIALFYFMFLRPQQRKEKERRKMIEELRVGAKVVFAGGIIGTIVQATEKTFTVETAPDVRMEVLRSCVQGVVAAEGAAN